MTCLATAPKENAAGSVLRPGHKVQKSASGGDAHGVSQDRSQRRHSVQPWHRRSMCRRPMARRGAATGRPDKENGRLGGNQFAMRGLAGYVPALKGMLAVCGCRGRESRERGSMLGLRCCDSSCSWDSARSGRSEKVGNRRGGKPGLMTERHLPELFFSTGKTSAP